MIRVVTVLWAAAIAAVFLALDPAVTPAALGRLVAGCGALLAWSGAALGGGGALLKAAAPALLEEEDGGLHAAVAGLGLWGLGATALAAAGQLNLGGMAFLAAALSAGWLTRPVLRWPSLPPLALAAAAAAGLLGLLDAMAPPIQTDELYYHLAVPAQMLQEGGLVGGLLHADGSRPMLLHLPYACLLATGGEAAPRLLHLALSGLVLAGCVSLGRRHLTEAAGVAAVLLLVASWSFTHELGLAANNLPVALAALMALDAALRGQVRGLAIGAAVALGIKYTAAGTLAGVFLVARLPWRARILAGLAALTSLLPWWLINLSQGLHPLFPFAGWGGEFTFQYMDKYGFGRSPLDMLLLPWRAVMQAEIDSFRLLGRLSPAWLALLPLALAEATTRPVVRRLAVVCALALMAWAAGPHWLRHLLPALPILALACAAGAARLSGMGQLALGAVLLAGMPANWGPLITAAADRLDAATGLESRSDYYQRTEESTWPAMSWARDHLPPDASPALLFTWTGYLLERPYVLGSVEDHIPVRHWLLTHGTDSLAALKAQGVTHLIIGRIGFLPQTYHFLSETQFQEELLDPLILLDELLLREAVLIHESRRVRIYRLPDEENSSAP